mmetsp:Transcript_14028/g.19130  ORF Transcript_14028/g.19130 Transcript_14028/m.19130 type:complete len:93 (-) Transcript_14028:46-324(-)
MVLKLNFTNRDQVSFADEADLIFMQLELGDYFDADGLNLPESLVKVFEIPRQWRSKDDQEFVDTLGDIAGKSTQIAVGVNFFVSLLVSKAMS